MFLQIYSYGRYLDLQHSLLYEEDEEEAQHYNQVCQGDLDFDLNQRGNLRLKSDEEYLTLLQDLLLDPFKDLLHIREEIKNAGSQEDATGKTGGEGDHQVPPDKGAKEIISPSCTLSYLALERRSWSCSLRTYSLKGTIPQTKVITVIASIDKNWGELKI